jgi:hypothetical protein
MGKVEVLRDALSIVDVVERAAAMLRGAISPKFGKAALIPELHGQADDGPALLAEDRGNGGGVDTAGHGDGNQAGLDPGARRKCGFELCHFRHDP